MLVQTDAPTARRAIHLIFTGENQVDCPPRRGRGCLHQHVPSCNLFVLQPERLHCPGDPVKIFAPHRDIDIPSEAPGVRLHFFHVEIHCETADDAVFEAGSRERRFYPSCQVKELFHTFLEERIDVMRHGVPSRIIASASRKLEPQRLVERCVARQIHTLPRQFRLRAAQLCE